MLFSLQYSIFCVRCFFLCVAVVNLMFGLFFALHKFVNVLVFSLRFLVLFVLALLGHRRKMVPH